MKHMPHVHNKEQGVKGFNVETSYSCLPTDKVEA